VATHTPFFVGFAVRGVFGFRRRASAGGDQSSILRQWRGCSPGLTKCDREQARAKQHETGRGHREESLGYEVVVTHDAPPRWMLVRIY